MQQGGLQQYANRSSQPIQRLRAFCDGEPRLTWTGLLSEAFPEAGTYLVGGTVRDILLGRNPKDIDLVVTNLPAQELESFLARQGAVTFVGKRFGTFKFIPHGCRTREPIDIALPRTESTTHNHTSGRGDQQINSDHTISIGQDLSRRDFTINAIAYQLQTEELIDPFFGLQDLDKGIIRTVLNPHERFFEDATRMLRGLRFASQLQFAIEQETWEAIQMNLSLLNNTSLTEEGTYTYSIPRAMIGKEFLLAFFAHPTHTLRLWEKSGALAQHIPELASLTDIVEKNGSTAMALTHQALETLFQKDLLHAHRMKQPSPRVLVAALGLFLEHASENLPTLCTRLHFHQFAKSDEKHIECSEIRWLLTRLHDFESLDPASLQPSAFERQFCSQKGQDLLLLMHTFYITQARHSIGRERLLQSLRRVESICQPDRPEPLISGRHLKQLGIEPGPEYRTLLDRARDAQLTGSITTTQEAIEHIQTIQGS